MGEIVAAVATAHAPQLVSRPPSDDPVQLDATIAAMRELDRLLAEAEPDAIVLIGNDHLEAFFLDTVPAFAVVVGAEVEGSFGEHQYRAKVHPELSRAILEGGLRAGFDLVYSQHAFMGHAFVVPMHHMPVLSRVPLVPMFVNVYLPPLPMPWRCYQLGEALGRIIAERPERVALLASGGMSHYPGTERYPHPDFEFDRWALRVLSSGWGRELAALTPERLDETGNSELLNWIVLLGAIGDRPAKILSYQPTWHHGHGVVAWNLAFPGARS